MKPKYLSSPVPYLCALPPPVDLCTPDSSCWWIFGASSSPSLVPPPGSLSLISTF